MRVSLTRRGEELHTYFIPSCDKSYFILSTANAAVQAGTGVILVFDGGGILVVRKIELRGIFSSRRILEMFAWSLSVVQRRLFLVTCPGKNERRGQGVVSVVDRLTGPGGVDAGAAGLEPGAEADVR